MIKRLTPAEERMIREGSAPSEAPPTPAKIGATFAVIAGVFLLFVVVGGGVLWWGSGLVGEPIEFSPFGVDSLDMTPVSDPPARSEDTLSGAQHLIDTLQRLEEAAD